MSLYPGCLNISFGVTSSWISLLTLLLLRSVTLDKPTSPSPSVPACKMSMITWLRDTRVKLYSALYIKCLAHRLVNYHLHSKSPHKNLNSPKKDQLFSGWFSLLFYSIVHKLIQSVCTFVFGNKLMGPQKWTFYYLPKTILICWSSVTSSTFPGIRKFSVNVCWMNKKGRN